MSILEIVGFGVLLGCGVGAILWVIGAIKIEVKITKDDK
jgi:hypothetical protein